MFFSTELLSRRDSGYGLLWLAATLGSKSSVKKIPKRSIQTANVEQLCELITQPEEPLALRLSSNLMVGVARVYKIKHEIFVTDVTTCFASLRKAMANIRSLTAVPDSELQMGQPSVRPDVVTLAADSAIALALEFDNFGLHLDDIFRFPSQRRPEGMDDDNDDNYTPESIAKKARAIAKLKGKQSTSMVEKPRGSLHILEEDHDQFLSASFEGNRSFPAGVDQSSSQIDRGMSYGDYDFGDNLFPGFNDADLAVVTQLGNELSHELGEGWMELDGPISGMDIDNQLDLGIPEDIMHDFAFDVPELGQREGSVAARMLSSNLNKENVQPGHYSPAFIPGAHPPNLEPLDQALEPLPINHPVDTTKAPRKPKRVRLLLDPITELTDEELTSAREQYVEYQVALKREAELKRAEKESGKIMRDIIWGVPNGLEQPILADFWSSIYRVQVESRSGQVRLADYEAEHPAKRRKVGEPHPVEPLLDVMRDEAPYNFNYNYMDENMDLNAAGDIAFIEQNTQRSSEEPERGRRGGSRPPSLPNSFDFPGRGVEQPDSGSQKTSLFPWDHAGPSSSSGIAAIPGGDNERIDFENADVKIVRSRGSHGGSSRESSVIHAPSMSGSKLGPVSFQVPGIVTEDFQLDIPGENSMLGDSQQQDYNLITLERNSFNFLEYCKVQLKTLPGLPNSLSFDDVVPVSSSTSRVAASAFYHCLVLATKDLIRVEQSETRKNIHITVI